jgi:hypothetical protein
VQPTAAPTPRKQSKKKGATNIGGKGTPKDKRAVKPSKADKAKKAKEKAKILTALEPLSPEQDADMGVPADTEAGSTTAILKMNGNVFSM